MKKLKRKFFLFAMGKIIRVLERTKRAFQDKDVREIFNLSFLAAFSLAASNIHNFFGTMMVGHIGEDATEQISAMGLALLILLLFTSPMNALASSSQTFISQFWGRGERKKALMSFKSMLSVSFFISLFMSVIVFSLGDFFMKIFSPSQKVAEYGKKFLSIRVIGLPATSMTFVMRSFFDAIGEPKKHLAFNLSSTIFCIVLSYILVFGIIFPRMELYGFSLASSLSSFFALFHAFLIIKPYLKEHFSVSEIKSENYRTDMFNFSLKNLKLSLPAGLSQFIASLSFLIFMWFSGFSGVEHQAVSFILVNILGVIMLPMMAIGTSLAGFTGRLIGKSEIERAENLLKNIIIVVGTFSLFASLILVILPELTMKVFSSEREIIESGRITLLTFAPSIIFVSISIMLLNALIGLGDTKFVVLVETTLHFLFFIPSLIILGPIMKLDSSFLWGLISIYFGFLSLALIFRVKSRKWIKKVF